MIYKTPPEIEGLNFSKEEKITARKNNQLLMLTLLTKMSCNFKCPYCFTTGFENRIKKPLKLSDYDDIFQEAVNLGAKSVWWVGVGEPMLFKKKYELLKKIKNYGLKTLMFTNGSMITSTDAKKLFDLDVSIYIKLNSFNQQIQNELVGNINGASVKMKNGLNNLINAGYSKGNEKLAIQSVITKKNIKDIPVLYRWARENNIVPFFEIIVLNGPHLSAMAKDIDLNKKEMKTIFENLLEIDQNEYGYTWIPTPPYVGRQCDKYQYALTVDPEGNVLSCAATRDIIGNIKERTLGEIWCDSFMDKIRNIDTYIEGKCAECEIQCNGCRAEAYAKTGNLFAEYNRCWRI